MPDALDAVGFDAILDNYTSHDEFEPSEEDKELVAQLNENFDKAYEARLPYERDWEWFRQYLKGEQLIVRSRDTGEIVRLAEEDSKRLRSINNVLRPTARSLVGKLTRTIPTITVVPATADFDEQHGARAGDALLQYARRKENLDLQYVEAMEYLPWAGNAIFQLLWNRHGGERLAWCQVCDFISDDLEMIGQECPQCRLQKETEQMIQQQEHDTAKLEAGSLYMQNMMEPVTPEDLEEVKGAVAPPDMVQSGPLPLEQEPPALIEVNEGDFEVKVLELRDFFSEPGASCVKDANWVCKRSIVHVGEARREFPEMADFLHAEENVHSGKSAEVRFSSADSYGEIEYLTDHCYVYEFHEKPTENYPKGRVIWKVNDNIVRKMDGKDGRPENPYACLGRFPFYHFTFDTNKGELWGEPFLAQAWHRQREINKLETQIREYVELCLNPKMLNPIGSRIAHDEITAVTGQIIKYNKAAGDPKFLDWPDLSPQVFGRRNELVGDIRLQASVTEQEAGGVQDLAGRAMAIIEAEADQQIGPILVRCHSEYKELHRGILKLFRKFARPNRVWTVLGPDGHQTFSFEDLKLSPGHDVQLEQADGMSRNPAIRQQQAIDLKNAAPELFIDPMTGMPDAKKFARYAGLNLRDKGYDIQATERAAASAIPYKIKQGLPFRPGVEDEPMIFAEELLGWLRGPGRREDPQVVAQVRQIWMFYLSWASQGQPPDALMQQLQGGGPGGQGQGAGPGAGPGGPDQTAPGGSANGPGHMGSDIRTQAGQEIRSADQRAERQARVQTKREG
jgi:hypothetical protein